MKYQFKGKSNCNGVCANCKKQNVEYGILSGYYVYKCTDCGSSKAPLYVSFPQIK